MLLCLIITVEPQGHGPKIPDCGPCASDTDPLLSVGRFTGMGFCWGLMVGPILMGLVNGAHIVTAGVTVRGLLNIAAFSGSDVSSYG